MLAIGRDLSQLSHGLTGRYWIMASILDSGQPKLARPIAIARDRR
jgi:hypothetical protein